MFAFNSIEQSQFVGVSSDSVPNSNLNQFSMFFGCPDLDMRIQIRISERQVQFLYYDGDYNDYGSHELKWNPEGVKDNDKYKEIGFISLARPEDTGNDFLEFPQNIGDMDIIKNNVCKLGELINDCINSWKEEFYGFPFLIDHKTKGEKVTKNMFRCFVRGCLLVFVYEFENRDQAFGDSPIYDKVRDKLRLSDVYRLLSAKIQYVKYLYKREHFSRNQNKYTFYTQKFADCLMDKRLNKVISPDNYGVSGTKWIDWINEKWDWLIKKMSNDSNDRQGWFYNPEEELERILERNRQQGREGGAKLKNELVLKIRRHMYSKHAIDRAMTKCCGKCLFWFAQVFMLLWSVATVASSVYLYSGKWNWFYEDYLFIKFGVIIFTFVFVSGVNSGDILNTFLPRIIVAEATAWLTVGFASVVLKGMSWIKATDTIFNTFVAVFIVVGALVLVKSKQHSPYYKRGENITKTLLIMNHSIFFVLALGCVFRFCFYDNLLRTNDFLSEESYKGHFDAVNKHLQRLEDVEKSINEYRTFARDYEFDDNEWEYNNAIIINIKRVSRETNISDFMVFACNLDTMDSKSGIEIVDNNLRLIDRLTPKLEMEIRETRNHLTSNFEETIQSWAIVNSKNNIKYTKSEYVNNLIDDVEKQKCSILVGDKQLYPSLLVFHALIVLVLAFVTQLFISDKSITEPL